MLITDKRREEIIKKRGNPEKPKLTYQQLANKYGVTRQRIHQIIMKPIYIGSFYYRRRKKCECDWCQDNITGDAYLVRKVSDNKKIIVDNGCMLFLDKHRVIKPEITKLTLTT